MKKNISTNALNPVFSRISALKFVKTITDYSGPIADFYDPMQSWLSEDVEFFLKDIKGRKTRILELGSGTGRIALPLAKKGHTVYAVDSSADMQKILRRKLKGPVARKVVPVQASISDMRISEKFDHAIMGLNTIYGLAQEDDRIASFRNIAGHLKKGAFLYIDTMLPGRSLLLNRPGVYGMYLFEDKRGNHCINISYSRYNVKTQRSMLNFLNIVTDRKGKARFYVTSSKEYYPSLGELSVLLKTSGFKVVAVFSDYKGTKLDPGNMNDDGQEVVIKAQKL